MRIPKTTSGVEGQDKYYNGFQNATANSDGNNESFGGPTPNTSDFTTSFDNSVTNFRGNESGADTVVTDLGVTIDKVSLDTSSQQENLSIKNTFIKSNVGTQDVNTSQQDAQTFWTNYGNTEMKNYLGFDTNDWNNAVSMSEDGGGAAGFLAGLTGATNSEISTLTASMTNLENKKDENFKEFHQDDWKGDDTLNPAANAAGTMAQDLRGTLGASNFTFDRDGSSNGTWTGVLNAVGSSAVASLGLDGLANSVMNLFDSDAVSSAEDAAQLIELNTATKDTIYTSKPGSYIKVRSLKAFDLSLLNKATGQEKSEALFNLMNIIRSNNFESLKKNGKISSTDDLDQSSTFRKKLLTYGGDVNSRGSIYTETTDNVYQKSNDLFTASGLSTLSDEEIRLITLLKNKNTYSKKLGYIYIKPFWKYNDTSITDGSDLQIPFEFNPDISEGAVQANYATETLINRLGQFQVYTGTNLSTLNIQLTYMALAPDTLSAEDENALGKAYGSDAWMYYWTNNRIEEMELKLRSLVFPDMVSGNGNLIKPPIIEVHLENNLGYANTIESVGDLYKYPINSSNQIDSDYLSVTRTLNGGTIQRYKKYIVNSVQIDKIDDASVEYPSYFGRYFNSSKKSYNPMYHVTTASDDSGKTSGWAGYSRRRSFKASLQCTEVTENFIDLVPDFNAYYNAWNVKATDANAMNNYVETYTNTGANSFQSVKDILEGSLYSLTKGLASLEDQLISYFEEARVISSLYYKASNDKDSYLYKLNNGTGVYENLTDEGKEEINKIEIENSESGSSVNINTENLKNIYCNINVPTSDEKVEKAEEATKLLKDYKYEKKSLQSYMLFESDENISDENSLLKKESLGISNMVKYNAAETGNELAIATNDSSKASDTIYKYVSPIFGTIKQLVSSAGVLDKALKEIDNKYVSADGTSTFFNTDDSKIYLVDKKPVGETLLGELNTAAETINKELTSDSDGIVNSFVETLMTSMSSDVTNCQQMLSYIQNSYSDFKINTTLEDINKVYEDVTSMPSKTIKTDDNGNFSTTQTIALESGYFLKFTEKIDNLIQAFIKDIASMASYLNKIYKTSNKTDSTAAGYIKTLTGKDLVTGTSDSAGGLAGKYKEEKEKYDKKGDVWKKANSIDSELSLIENNLNAYTNPDVVIKSLVNAYKSVYQSTEKAIFANIIALIIGRNLYGVKATTTNVSLEYYKHDGDDVKKVKMPITTSSSKAITTVLPYSLGIIPLSLKHIADNIIDVYKENATFAKNVLNEVGDSVSLNTISTSMIEEFYKKFEEGGDYVSGNFIFFLVKSVADSFENSNFKELIFDKYIEGLKLSNTDELDSFITEALETLATSMSIIIEMIKKSEELCQEIDNSCSDLIKKLYGFYSKDGLQKQFNAIAGYYSGSGGKEEITDLKSLNDSSEDYKKEISASSLDDYNLYKNCFKSWYEEDKGKLEEEGTSFSSDTNGIIPYMFYKLKQQQKTVNSLKIAGSVTDVEVAEKLGAEV